MWVKTSPFIPSSQSQQSRRQFCLIDAGSFSPPRINKNRRDANGCSEVSSRRSTQTRFLLELGTAPCQANGESFRGEEGRGRGVREKASLVEKLSPPSFSASFGSYALTPLSRRSH